MGFFDQLMNDVNSAGAGGQSAAPAGIAPALIAMLGDSRSGGLAGLLQAFEQGGLGHIASSWLGNGQNLPVSADQIQSVLGSGRIQELAQKAGIPPEEASQAIAAILPGLVDKLTPNGQVDQGLLGEGLAMFKHML